MEELPVITDAEIDLIAELTIKAMPDGLRGFCRTWGWQQFARTLLENLRPYGLRATSADTSPAHVCAQAYQVVGSLLSDLGQFETARARKILDNLSQARVMHDDVLPWPSFVGPNDVRDAARWRAMRELLVGADWEWGDPPTPVAVFALKAGTVQAGPAGADAIADAAISHRPHAG